MSDLVKEVKDLLLAARKEPWLAEVYLGYAKDKIALSKAEAELASRLLEPTPSRRPVLREVQLTSGDIPGTVGSGSTQV